MMPNLIQSNFVMPAICLHLRWLSSVFAYIDHVVVGHRDYKDRLSGNMLLPDSMANQAFTPDVIIVEDYVGQYQPEHSLRCLKIYARTYERVYYSSDQSPTKFEVHSVYYKQE